jgi:hypothetical protein
MTNYLETYRRDRTPGYITGIKPQAGFSYPGGIPPYIYLQADMLSDLGEGALISSWIDIGTGNHPATQSTEAYRPVLRLNDLNAHATVEFDGTDDYITFGDIGSNFPSEATAIFVVNINDTGYSLLGTTSPNESWWRWDGDGDGYIGTWKGTREGSYPVTMPASGVHVMALRSYSYNYEFFLDGVSKGALNGDFNSGSVYTIPDTWFSVAYLTGKIACALLYNSALDNTEIGTVVSDLQTIYGL